MRRWLELFRLPNLPTAPGDALAGAAFFLPAASARVPDAFVAAFMSLCLYMYGLVDNDLTGLRDDLKHAPQRPLPSGRIPVPAARLARTLLLGLAFAAPGLSCLLRVTRPRPPLLCWLWMAPAVALVACVLLYNRTKNHWWMAACRGLSVACGALAVWNPAATAGFNDVLLASLAVLAYGWMRYTKSISELAEGEETDSPGLPAARFFHALDPLLPLAAFIPAFSCGTLAVHLPSLAFPLVGCLCASAAWFTALLPLGAPHTSRTRRAAVGRTIHGLLYLQIGFMLVTPRPPFILAAAVLWFVSRLIRRLTPSISAS